MDAQERKSSGGVYDLAWNSEIPFRVALARGFFKAQGLEIQPIFVRGGPAAMGRFFTADSEISSEQELRVEGKLKPSQ